MPVEYSRSDASLPAPRLPGIAALGAILGGSAAMSCCVVPLVFVLAGVSGAWIANLTALSPYQPIFVAVALGAIAYGHLAAYRARRACANGAGCARPAPRRLVDVGLWIGTVMVAIAIAADFAAPMS